MIETDTQKLFLKQVPFDIPDLRLFRRQIHTFKVEDLAGKERVLSAGIKGQADLHGYFRGGQGIEIELKSHSAITTKLQLEWESFCFEWGVYYLRLREVKGDPVLVTVGKWISAVKALRA